MATAIHRYLKWFRYSGASVILVVNPLHWQLTPRAMREHGDGWAGPNERTWSVSWLFFTLRIWIDDGSW